jgi:hypothetical protein
LARARADVNPSVTPAGHTLQAFFRVFISGDREQIAAYEMEYDPQKNADRLTSFSGQTGGFILKCQLCTAPPRAECSAAVPIFRQPLFHPNSTPFLRKRVERCLPAGKVHLKTATEVDLEL